MKNTKAFWCCLLQSSVSWLYLELSLSYSPQHCWGSREVLVKKNYISMQGDFSWTGPFPKDRVTLSLQLLSFALGSVGSFHMVQLPFCLQRHGNAQKKNMVDFKRWITKKRNSCFPSCPALAPWQRHLAQSATKLTFLTVLFSLSCL